MLKIRTFDSYLFHITLTSTSTPVILNMESRDGIPEVGQPQQQIQTESIWSKMTEEELNRYEMFRRSTFPKASIKRLMQSMTGAPISQNVVIAMSGMAKVFVGELVEEAVRVQARYGDTGPIEPRHLREAHRVLKHRHDKSVKIF